MPTATQVLESYKAASKGIDPDEARMKESLGVDFGPFFVIDRHKLKETAINVQNRLKPLHDMGVNSPSFFG